MCRKEKNYFFPPFSGGKGWKKRVLQLLLNTVEAGDQELRPGGLSWGYEGVHVTTGTPKNGLWVSAAESTSGVEGTFFGREEEISKIPLLYEPNLMDC